MEHNNSDNNNYINLLDSDNEEEYIKTVKNTVPVLPEFSAWEQIQEKNKNVMIRHTPPPTPYKLPKLSRIDEEKSQEVHNEVSRIFGPRESWKTIRQFSQTSTIYLVCHHETNQEFILKYINPGILNSARRKTAKLVRELNLI
jgi:hypothetical protein